jgi:uncharacterized protein involved in outer membrane biogenesis
MNRRLRITLLSVAGIMLLLATAALVLAYVMLRPERFTGILRNSARNAGMELTLTAPAKPTLWPRPGVRLQGLQLYVQGQSYPVLVADSGRIVVPWRTLLDGKSAITKLELNAPRLDLGQLRRALATLPEGSGKSAKLPRIDTGITIRNGALVHDNEQLLQDIDLHTGALVPDQAFSLVAHARNAAGQPQQLKLQFKPRMATQHAIELSDMLVDVHAGKTDSVQLRGTARWAGNGQAQLHLSGRLHTQASGDYDIAVQTAPTPTAGDTLHLKVQGKAGKADLNLSPDQVAVWWQRIVGAYAPGALPPPPVDGSIDAQQIDLGPIQIKGLKLRSGSAIPAPAASTADPAGQDGK